VDSLADDDFVVERTTLLTNRLVVVVPIDSNVAVDASLQLLADPSIERVALADPNVPAGSYADEALRNAGLADRVDSKVVRAVDVRAALAWVERGEAEAGIVYATDAAASSESVRVAHRIDPSVHAPIRYVLGLVTGADQRARSFADFLRSDEAASIFAAHGFDRAER